MSLLQLRSRFQAILPGGHDQPYHGRHETDEDEVRRGKAKSGTTHFHSYATAYIVRKGRRLTLALHFVRAGESVPQILEALKCRLDPLKVRVRRWMADRGFCSVEALEWFIQQPLAYVPLTVRGKKSPPSASRALLELRRSQWTRYTMTSSQGQSLEFDVAVVRRRRQCARTSKKPLPPRTLLYCVVGQRAAAHVASSSPEAVASGYRGRFGIESSYRQSHQGLLRTTSRSPVLRLLAMGIALILRNLWVLCCWLSMAHRGPGRRSLKSRLRLSTVLRWIRREIDERLTFMRKIALQAPSPLRF